MVPCSWMRDLFESRSDDRFESVGLLELLDEALAEAGELVLDGFVVGLGLHRTDVAARCENEVVPLQVIEGRDPAEPRYVFVWLLGFAAAPRMIGAGNLGDIGIVEHS